MVIFVSWTKKGRMFWKKGEKIDVVVIKKNLLLITRYAIGFYMYEEQTYFQFLGEILHFSYKNPYAAIHKM